MASKRNQRRRSCKSKFKHLDRESAQKHAYRLGKNHMPYRCKFCGGWHVGRPNKRKRISLSAKARNRHRSGEET